jgi:hypothetical protein
MLNRPALLAANERLDWSDKLSERFGIFHDDQIPPKRMQARIT